MGVDIYGISPQIKSEKPEIDYNTASEAEVKAYMEIRMDWEKENPGYYFRSNWWGWRPIHALADFAIKTAGLDFDTSDWGSNDGGGLKTQDECNALADAMEMLLILNKKNMSEESDRIYICLGCWVTSEGKFIDSEKTEELNKAFPIGTIMYNGAVASDGTLVFSAHSASLLWVEEFITFLRNCGGFQIF